MKLTIKNRKGQEIVVLVEEQPNQKGLAFIMHGLGGFKEQLHIQIFAQAFRDAGYTTVLFDTTNTYGESDGKYEDATTTNYYEDLEDVISWANGQSWYQEPFCLAGHSLGGYCTARYAELHPEKVKALAPISTMISGALSIKYNPKKCEDWKRTGWYIHESETKPGLMKRLPWSHMEDRLKHDLLPDTHKLTMPVLMIVGDQDKPEHQRELYDKLPGRKELHIVKGAPHIFRDPAHLQEIKTIFDRWIKSLG